MTRSESKAPPVPTLHELELVTFNVGLAPTVARRAERAPKIAEAVGSATADVLCLQEVWGQADVERIEGALERAGRTVVRGPRQSAERATQCSQNDVNAIRACVDRSCRGSNDQVACVLAHCRSLVSRLSADCVSCLAQDPDLDPTEALRSCSAGRTSTDFVYSGNTGLLLALAEAPKKTETFLLPSKNVARGVVLARSEAPPLDVYCTHFTARGELGSRAEWQRLAAEQARVLVREVERRSGDRAVAVLGDLNFENDAPAFEAFVDSRFRSEYAERDGRCTLCGGGPRFVIDHVLTREPLRPTSAARIWDDAALSDHHAVRVTVALPTRS